MQRAESITFLGPDGSGKSTIAASLHQLIENGGHQVQMIGGSSYKSWLTPKIAREYIGDTHSFIKTAKSDADRIRLYEDIAIVCYAHSKRLTELGTNVLIDSDPYLKRIAWSRLSNNNEENLSYEQQFENRMSEYIGDTYFPDWVVGVNVVQEGSNDAVDHYSRIKERGVVTDYDPNSADESEAIGMVTASIWKDIIMDRRHKRTSSTKRIEMLNPDRPIQEIGRVALELATNLYDKIYKKV